MSDVLISSSPVGSFTGYNTYEDQNGSSTTYDSLSYPILDRQVWGSGVQKTPNFKNRKGIDRLKSGPGYHKQGWVEARGTRFQVNNSDTTGYYYQNNPNWPVAPTWSHTTQEHAGSGLFPNIPDPATLLAGEEADRIAVGKLLDKLAGDGANLANTLGERKQVESQIVTTMKRLGNAALALRRRDVRAATRYLLGDGVKPRPLKGKLIADWWLEMQYGWKPLLSDVYSVVEGLHHRESSRFYKLIGAHQVTYGGLSGQSWGLDSSGVQKGRVNSTVAAKYVVLAVPDGILRAPASLGFTNPLTVAWEVTPWSFVVDWFLPVGNYLNQLSADHGWTFIDGSVSRLIRESKDFEWSKTSGPTLVSEGSWPYQGMNTTSYQYERAFGNCAFWDFTRAPLAGFPAARLPRVKNPFSPGHFMNALALMSQIFSGGPVRKH